MIDPKSILIATACYNGKVDMGYAGGLAAIASQQLFGGNTFLSDCSHVALARNAIVSTFLRSNFEWLFFIDDDIGFSAEDYRLVMGQPTAEPPVNQELHDMATLFEPDDERAGLSLITCAEYARKIDGAPPARLGLGFCKIHRVVFSLLDQLNLDTGEARVDAFMFEGRLVKDYFLCGAADGRWLGEDTGFFSLCRLANIHPRVEQRTRLVHTGRKSFDYRPTAMAAQ